MEAYDDEDECFELPQDPRILAARQPRAFAVGELKVRSIRSSTKILLRTRKCKKITGLWNIFKF